MILSLVSFAFLLYCHVFIEPWLLWPTEVVLNVLYKCNRHQQRVNINCERLNNPRSPFRGVLVFSWSPSVVCFCHSVFHSGFKSSFVRAPSVIKFHLFSRASNRVKVFQRCVFRCHPRRVWFIYYSVSRNRDVTFHGIRLMGDAIAGSASPSSAFTLEWRSSVERSYFGLVEHREKSHKLPPVHLYQPDVSRCSRSSPNLKIMIKSCTQRRPLLLHQAVSH